MTPSPLFIRPRTDADLPAVTAIHGEAVRRGTGSFETDAPELAEMARRRHDALAKGQPGLVAQAGDDVLGYACAAPFRPRRTYRYTLKDSIYLHSEARGQGVGRLMPGELLARCKAWGGRQMLAVIGDSQNRGSVALHRALGPGAAIPPAP